MCGIAGMVRFDDEPIALDRLAAMLEAVRHRGPDGAATLVRGHCGLAHARLSIVDHAGGSQPMQAPATDQAGPLAVVFNGMIYNHRTLRKTLEQQGHRFTSDHSDTEVLLHGYRQWGCDLLAKLDGFFAFALWDEPRQSLLLARDRTGKKPLYFHRDETQITFASVPAAVMAGLAEAKVPQVDGQALRTYLRFGDTLDQSLVRGLNQLPAAHWLSIDARRRVRSERYWQRPTQVNQPVGDDPTSTLANLLTASVQRRLEADVPLGCFLSGGVDSSVVAAIAHQQLTAQQGEPLQTFSVKMDELDYDESAFAQCAADHLGTRHTVLQADAKADVIGDLARLIHLTGQPTADSSLLPTFWLSRAASAQVKVALSGDGGDEIFGGYDRYRALRLLNSHRWWLRRVPAGWVRPHAQSPDALRTRLHRLRQAAAHRAPAAQYLSMIQLFDDAQIRALGLTIDPQPQGLHDWPDDDDVISAAMRWDQSHYLPHDLLRKVDRASMSAALEVRCPLLDTALIEWAGTLPRRTLLPGRRSKGLLRQLAGRLLPAAIAKRAKRGFALPIGRWFCQSLRQPLREHLLDADLSGLGLHRAAIEHLLNQHLTGQADHTHRLFALLSLSLWQQWREGPVKNPGSVPFLRSKTGV